MMERRENNKEYFPPCRSSPINPFLPSSSSSTTSPANHPRQTLYSEYHPVDNTNTALPSPQIRQNFWPFTPENRRETISSIPEYLPENYFYFLNNMSDYHPGNFLMRPNQATSYVSPDNNLGYDHQYNRKLNSDDQLALNDVLMNALTISDGPSFRHQTAAMDFERTAAMDLERRRIQSAVNGYSYTAAPYGTDNHYHMHQTRSRNKYSSLREIRGRIAAAAMDEEGCLFLQKILKKPVRRVVVEAVFPEIIESVSDLMVHQFGHHVVQDVCGGCNVEEITRIVHTVCSDYKFMNICLDVHGTRAIQTLLENLKTLDQLSIVLSGLWPITNILTRSENGHHIIQKCLSLFSFEHTMYIANDIANDYAELAMDKSGCCVLQTCVTNAKGELRECLIANLIANTLIFSENPYGNYVVQFLLGLWEPHVRQGVLAQLEGRFVSLSMNKYGSNVAEKCFKECTPDETAGIIKELINSPNFVAVLQDQYGNYVAQAALRTSIKQEGNAWNNLVNEIQSHRRSLHSHPYGKRVLLKSTENKNS